MTLFRAAASALLILAFSAPAFAQWHVDVKQDKLTDKNVLHATVAGFAENKALYQLTLTCQPFLNVLTDQPDFARELSVTTFTRSEEGRPSAFNANVEQTGAASYVGGVRIPETVLTETRRVRFRRDSEPLETERLASGEFNNQGKFPYFNFGKGLPSTRFLLADVFPDEVVEFSFSTLTLEQRQQLQTHCYKPDPATQKASPTAFLPHASVIEQRPISVWIDRTSGEPLTIPDLWVRPGQLKPLRDYGRMTAILKMIDAPMVRDQYETVASFERRRTERDRLLSEMLSEPLMLVGWGGNGVGETFIYDADNEIMSAVVSRNYRGLVSDSSGGSYVVMTFPHDDLVLLMPSAPFTMVQPAKRGLFASQSASTKLLSFACTFPMPASEARERGNRLSLIYRVPVETILARDNTLGGNSGTDAVPYGLLTTQSPDKVEVWIVDVERKQRIANGPLSACLSDVNPSFPNP